jgi:hypothetical protein
VRARSLAGAFAACALVVGAGCTSISLRASEARMPVLLGPVACIGCDPVAGQGAAPPTVRGGVRERSVGIPAPLPLGSLTYDRASLDLAVAKAVADPCREDLHVSAIEAGTWIFHVPILLVAVDTWVDVQASGAAVPSGTCGPAPWPSSGPAGVITASPENPSNRRQP